MASQNKPGATDQGNKAELEHMKKRLDLLDQRLDNIDSVVSAVAERMMTSRIIFNVTCPNCGKNVEISMVGSTKPTISH
ncbi:MAG: hypothetical protein HYX81_05395 [Chloroflexi bacterium]|nr:hypothetical protein [Chloroflexota bacterium]